MLAASPFTDATNHLLLLAEASERLPLVRATNGERLCAEVAASPADASMGKKGDSLGFQIWCDEAVGSAARLRPPSRRSVDEGSERSSSPALGRYLCRRCYKEYASTDAVRKHARQQHHDWLREQGQGCPSLYCTVIEAGPETTAGSRVAPQGVSTPTITMIAAPTFSPAEDESSSEVATPEDALFNAAESFIALSKAALAPSPLAASAFDVVEDDEEGSLQWMRQSAPRPGQKRPRSVRCGKCDGCERDDCGSCKNCLDKPKFGGIGQRKQGCVKKICRAPRVAT